jgi:hypothetical protein
MHEEEIDLQKLEEILEYQKSLDEMHKGAQPSMSLSCLKSLIVADLKDRLRDALEIKSEFSWKKYIQENRYYPSRGLCEGCQASYTCGSYKKSILVKKDPFSGKRKGVY